MAGFSLVFILLGASASLLGQWMLLHLAMLGKVAGAVILVGSLIFLGGFSVIATWLINWFPFLADIEAAFVP